MPAESRDHLHRVLETGRSSSPVVCGNGRGRRARRSGRARRGARRDPAATCRPGRRPRPAATPEPETARHVDRHCAVPYHWHSPRVECQRLAGAGRAAKENRAHLPVRLHRVRPRLRAGPELLRRRADRLPQCEGRLRKLFNAVGVVFRAPASTAPTAAPTAAPARVGSTTSGGPEKTSEKKSETTTTTKTESKPAARPPRPDLSSNGPALAGPVESGRTVRRSA